MVWLTYAPVTTVARRHSAVSETAVGWLANLFPLLYLPLAIPAGLALDRRFRARSCSAAVLTAGGAWVRLVDDTFAWALLGQVAVAVAQPFVLNAVTGITGHYLEEEERREGHRDRHAPARSRGSSWRSSSAPCCPTRTS